MAFSGKLTAAGHLDLLAKVTDFITGAPDTPGRDWTVARQDSLAHGPAAVFRNTGLAGTEEVFVGLYAATNGESIRGGLVCKVYKAFDGAPDGTAFLDTVYGNGVGQNGTHAFLPCWNAAMNVWIWSNKARVIIVAECNGLYGNAYLGQLRRFSLPSENPWPLACLTDGYTNLWKDTTWHDSISSPGSYDADQNRRNLAFVRRGCFPTVITNYSYFHACHQICRPDGVWTSHFAICPTSCLFSLSSTYEISMQMDTLGTMLAFPENTPRLLLPFYFILLEGRGNYEGASAIGEMYGVRWAPDALAGVESDVDGYTLFPDVSRVAWHSFMAIGDE